MRHVHVSHGEKHVVYISKTKKIKNRKIFIRSITKIKENVDITGWCFNSTSTRHGSGCLAFKEVRICSWDGTILLQAPVQFHMEAILILLLYWAIFPILGPFLCTLNEELEIHLHSQFLNNPVRTHLVPKFSIISKESGSHLHQRKLQISPKEGELAVGTAE